MVAFSCCKYDGGEEEKHDMDIVRERSWRGKFRRRGRVIRPGANRVDGKCPLTPLEVSLSHINNAFYNNNARFTVNTRKLLFTATQPFIKFTTFLCITHTNLLVISKVVVMFHSFVSYFAGRDDAKRHGIR